MVVSVFEILFGVDNTGDEFILCYLPLHSATGTFLPLRKKVLIFNAAYFLHNVHS